MSRHTPGPWVIRDANDRRASYDGHFDVVSDGLTVCTCWLAADKSETGEENARLIAAAPELAEALTDLTELLERLYGFRLGNSHQYDDALAALRKAGVLEGENG